MTAECTIGEFYVYQAEKNYYMTLPYSYRMNVMSRDACQFRSYEINYSIFFIVGAFVTGLYELDRQDAADVVLNSAPIYKIIHDHSNV